MSHKIITHTHLPHNKFGNDYIIGDLHGCYNVLMKMLDKIGFDKSKDRLFSVGDLIDRGPQSFDCANLLYEPYFYSTLGNHEQMCYESILYNHPDYIQMWRENGGMWHIEEDKQLLEDLAIRMTNLPLVISVGDDDNRFNITHGELIRFNPKNLNEIWTVDNNTIDNWEFTSHEMFNMLWGRTVLYHHDKHTFHSPNLSPTFVGHSTTKTLPKRIQQHIYLDTGACLPFLNPDKFKPYRLSLISPTLNKLFSLNIHTNTITEYNTIIHSNNKYNHNINPFVLINII